MKPFEKSIHSTILSIWAELREKISFLARFRNLGLLANTFTANNLFWCNDKVNLLLPFQMQLSQKLKTFSEFFIAFLKFTFIFEQLEKNEIYFHFWRFRKKWTLIIQVFRRLLTLKHVLTSISQNTFLWKPFGTDVLTSLKNWWNLQKYQFMLLFHHIWAQLIEKKLILARFCNLRLVANTLTANNYFSLVFSDNVNLPLAFQMQWFKKLKRFSRFFIAFLKITSIFEHFGQKMSLVDLVVTKLLTLKHELTWTRQNTFLCEPFGSDVLTNSKNWWNL